MSSYIHPTANVSTEANIGDNSRVWENVQIRERASIGDNCIIGKGSYIDFEVKIGSQCKLQNGVFVYHGATLEDGVFLGPGVMLLNDKNPRAINSDGTLKSAEDWQVSPTHIGYGAGIGGGAVILPNVSVGKWSIVGSGSVVSRSIPDYGLAYGNPARLYGFVCPCGKRATPSQQNQTVITFHCSSCQQTFTVPVEVYQQALVPNSSP